MQIVRAFNAELVYIRSPFPMGKDGLKIKNGQIILSAGWDIGDSTGTLNVSAESGANGSLLIGSQAATHFTSNVFGIANGDITARSL